MSEKPFPEIDKPYSMPAGFRKWRPQHFTLTVETAEATIGIVVRKDGLEVAGFHLTPAQRDEFVALLLAETHANAIDSATQNVAGQGAQIG
jgi:hypothetical protein